MSSSKNLEYEKTSFLNKSNSAFIEQMYLKFINKDSDLAESWRKYFEGIGEELDVIAKEINGPSWSPAKYKIDIRHKSLMTIYFSAILTNHTIHDVVEPLKSIVFPSSINK